MTNRNRPAGNTPAARHVQLPAGVVLNVRVGC